MLGLDGGAPYQDMSPTLLSEQPPAPPPNPKKEQSDWDSIFQHLENRLTALKTWRYSWWAFHAVLAAFFLPFRYIWLIVANRMWRGGNLNNQIINSHGVNAVRTCAAGLWTGLCSPSRPWFKLGLLGLSTPVAKLPPEVKAWLKHAEDIVYAVLSDSNFYTIMAQAFRDEVVFGTAPVLIYEDAENVVRFYLPCAGEYCLGNGARLDANTLGREFAFTVLQCVDMFTLENCPQEVQSLWNAGNYDTEVILACLIEPNFPIARRGASPSPSAKVQIVSSEFDFREVYWRRGSKSQAPMSKRGFHGKPFMALRWALASNDAYGRGPCMDAIGDNKQIQIQDLRKAEFIEKGVRPPMGADTELNNLPASIMPSGITYMNTAGGVQKKFWPLFEVKPEWLAGLTADITKVEARIDHCLYVDLFMAISRMEGVQPRNELELTKRDLERLQELGPVIDLAEKELDTCITRMLDITERRGMLQPRPDAIANTPLKVNYVSILRLAQRSSESVAFKDVFQTGGQLSSAAKAAGVPDPLRVINLDKAYRKYAELANFDPDLMFDDDEVQQHDALRAKAQQQAQMPAQAMAGVTAAKTLSETALPGGNSALGALLGQGGSAPPA